VRPFFYVDSTIGTIEPALVAEEEPALDFGELFREHAPYAWRLLRRLGVADSDAKDVCQEVFVIVHAKLDRIPSRASARAYIYGVSVRAASDYRRLARVRHERLTDDVPDGLDPFSPDKALDDRRAAAYLHEVLSRMADPKREVFVLYELEELSMNEIVEIVGCPLQTAYSRLHAARLEVKQAFSRLELQLKERTR
jgi:RNA polymerase sigma-70 factor (ECF subfamily)